jgi:CRISPR-associated exonuclease Cas4
MCLEEMLCCEIPEGALYYGEIRRREPVEFTEEMRQLVRDSLKEMHMLYQKGYTPKVKPSRSCNACSLKEQCLPKLMKKRSVAEYFAKAMEETT